MNRVTANGPGSNNIADVNQRVAEIKAATGLPVWCFIDRMSRDAASQYNCDRRVPAYFPYLGSDHYGPEDWYGQVGDTARALDGDNATAALQGFGWWIANPA
jgi:hypothetical protein